MATEDRCNLTFLQLHWNGFLGYHLAHLLSQFNYSPRKVTETPNITLWHSACNFVEIV
jgi:hypothetical protein